MDTVTLSTDRFEQAKEFIRQTARPLDQALFAYRFEDGPAETVLAALAAYQNTDGGFGQAIEPDFRMAASSPMATSVGLQYATAVSAPAAHPLIQGAVRYLLHTYDEAGAYWPATSAAVNDAPHAFWWHVTETAPPEEGFWPNPSAELVGYLHHYSSLVPPEFLARVTARAEANLACSPLIGGEKPQQYSILCWQRAAPYLPEKLQTAVHQAIARTLLAFHPVRPDTFGELSVLAVAPDPESALALQEPEAVAQALDVEITRQQDDGGWWPNWHWGQFEDVWPVAEKEWAGKITAETLWTLRRFGRLAGLRG
ncbi:MAG: hypothetical protein H6659_12440 [Ardenticatenaceae bacterium]|nr:hypothetical protein [Ardenticatenaceae bacterium]